jgi:hypothetical protein
MFVLDTNVLSELMRLEIEREVASWIATAPDELLFTTTISQAEIFSGLAILPQGRRRRDVEATARLMFEQDFAGRVLPFDAVAAIAHADAFAARVWSRGNWLGSRVAGSDWSILGRRRD